MSLQVFPIVCKFCNKEKSSLQCCCTEETPLMWDKQKRLRIKKLRNLARRRNDKN